MDKYQEYVEYMAKNQVDFLFGNSSSVHAAIVMSTILKYADKKVFLYIKNLDGTVFDSNSNFEKEVGNFLSRGGKMEVMVEDGTHYPSTICTKLLTLRKAYPSTFFIMKDDGSKTFKKQVKSIITDPTINEAFYMVADNKAYRLETNSTQHIAYCNFNDSERANKLGSTFSINYPMASPNQIF